MQGSTYCTYSTKHVLILGVKVYSLSRTELESFLVLLAVKFMAAAEGLLSSKLVEVAVRELTHHLSPTGSPA